MVFPNWSPLHAMKAYMHTLRLCKDCHKKDCTPNCGKPAEPKCIEFLSALAAGNQAKLMVDISSTPASSSTLALAIAARYTGGRLVCFCVNEEDLGRTKARIERFDLGDVAEFKVGNPSELVKGYRNVDFAVVDHGVKNCVQVLEGVEMNPSGSVVVVSNLFRGRDNGDARVSYRRTVRGRGYVKSAVLPIGNGMEVTRIGKSGKRTGRIRSCKRTFMVYEECRSR